MTIHRYTFADPYVVAELKGRYDAADVKGRIRLLADLYRDEDYQPPYEIAALAVGDPDVEVRRWIARNGRYLDYKETDSREQVTNSDIRDLWERLKVDPDPLVRAQLRENPDILPLFGRIEKSKYWFRESSHLERLALVRNERIEEDFIEQLFDPEDSELGIALGERFELCCAFLTNQKVIEKNAKDAGLLGDSSLGALFPLGASYYAGKLFSSLWLNAAKWPKGSGNLQHAVYGYIPASDETKADVYKGCDEPAWRKAILHNSDARRDPTTFAAALLDRNDSCRELAYQRVADVDDKQLKALLKGQDKAALRGLADNRVLEKARQSAVHQQVRARLRELGGSTTAFEEFDLMYLGRRPQEPGTRGANDRRRLTRRLRAVQKNVDEVKARLDRLSSFYSFPSLILFACAVGFVTALFVRWFR